MELVYLWIDKYKNFSDEKKNNEFNFNPELKFEFQIQERDENHNILKSSLIKKESKQKNYIKNLYGEGISITAIAGENGTGKSSIMEIIEKNFTFSYGKDGIESQKLFLFKEGNTYTLITDILRPNNTIINNAEIHIEVKTEHQSNIINKLNFFTYYSEMPYQCKMLDMDEYSRSANPCYARGKYQPPKVTMDNVWTEYKTVTFDKRYIGNFIYHLSKEQLFDKFDNDIFSPEYISIEPNDFFEEIPDEFDDLRKKIYRGEGKENSFPNKKNLLVEIYERHLANRVVALYMHEIENLKEDVDSSFPKLIYGQTEENIYKLENFFRQPAVAEKHYNSKSYEVLLNIPCGRDIPLTDLEKKTKDLLLDEYFNFFRIDYIDNDGRKYNNLSHGEKTYFALMVNILMKIGLSTQNNRNFLLYLDEADLSMHPKWQRDFMNKFIKLLNSLIKQGHAQNIQVILTTHSPFILSDIPKENIIFLNNEQKTLDSENTFGANIHTLLSDGFFMDNDLMGAFAKEKIQEVISFLNPNLNISGSIKVTTINETDALKIIQVIGEPFLRKKLLEMFESQFGLPNDDKVQEINREIKELVRKKSVIEEESIKKQDNND